MPLSQRDEVLLRVGECLHQWSWVELEISNLYMVMHRIKLDEFSHPDRVAFEAVISLEAKLALIEGFISADGTIRDAYIPHFRSLKNRVLKLYKKRHEVAHFMVVARQRKKGLETLIRPFFTLSTFTQEEGTELDKWQLAERAELFRELAERVRRHIQHVGGQLRGLPLAHYVRAGDTAFPPLSELDLNPEEPTPPPSPSPE